MTKENKENYMQKSRPQHFFILGICLFLGLVVLGYQLSTAALKIKEYERTVIVKGLSEREVNADIVIWPIRFIAADNELATLYKTMDANAAEITAFLTGNGIAKKEISSAAPVITDKLAQQYDNKAVRFRYSGSRTITVYSKNVQTVRKLMTKLSKLGKKGIVFSGMDYDSRPEYIFTGLNRIKPAMIEEATRKAREVALKFAADSQSKLGKIKRASQGRFSIRSRDRNTPYIKKIRIVSTVEYYLSD